MIKKILLFLLLLQASVGYAETIKTSVLVIGGSASGVAAAMQSARSKVKTMLIESGGSLGSNMASVGKIELQGNRNLPSGIWGEFQKKIRDHYLKTPGYDTAYNAALRFEAPVGVAILKKMTDTVKNLTIKLNASFVNIKKEGSGWEVSVLVNGKTEYIKARVVIDATETAEVATKTGAKFADQSNHIIQGEVNIGMEDITASYNQQSTLYRTSIAVGEPASLQPYTIPLGAIVVKGQDNLLVTETAIPSRLNADPAVLMSVGQGAGATAAYCAFFKTTTKNLKVRIIQGELLDFKAYLMPLEDIRATDPNFRAIQQVCATGLLKGIAQKQGNTIEILFKPDSTINTADVKPMLNEIYTRAFIWFMKEKPKDVFTVGNLLSFISDYTLTDPATLQHTLQKAWKTQYKFKLDFNLNRPVTRREFAVLANKFLNPFARTVDLSGKLMN